MNLLMSLARRTLLICCWDCVYFMQMVRTISLPAQIRNSSVAALVTSL